MLRHNSHHGNQRVEFLISQAYKLQCTCYTLGWESKQAFCTAFPQRVDSALIKAFLSADLINDVVILVEELRLD